MPKEKDKTEATEKMPPSPGIDVMPQRPDKMGGPQSDTSSQSTKSPASSSAPQIARSSDLRTASDGNMSAPGRARLMRTVQRTVGNTRVGLAGGVLTDQSQTESTGQPETNAVSRSMQPAAVQRQDDGGVKKDPSDAGVAGKTTATPDYATDDLKQKMTATILAEAWAGQETDIRWMYFNRVTSKKGIEGLKGSAAYSNKGIWYRIWLYVLGDHTYGDDKLPKQDEFKGFATVKDFCEKNEYMKTVAAARAKEIEKLVNEMFEKPEANPYKGWTGQGNLDDFNNKSKPKSRYWKMARAYYWLQQKGTVKEIFVKVLPAGKNTQVIFDGASIEKYYESHDLPDNVPLYEPGK
jgi:hypothetical protein